MFKLKRGRCEDCNRELEEGRRHNSKYCRECGYKRRLEYYKDYNHKKRKKS